MIKRNSATYTNLLTAFDSECKSFTRYLIYSNRAAREGFGEISDIFYDTAMNELSHAKLWQSFIEKSDTQNYLHKSVTTEYKEGETMYTDFATVAKREGYVHIASLFLKTAQVEKRHREKFASLWDSLDRADIFYSDKKTVWKCKSCGNTAYGFSPPQKCDLCGETQGKFIKEQGGI